MRLHVHECVDTTIGQVRESSLFKDWRASLSDGWEIHDVWVETTTVYKDAIQSLQLRAEGLDELGNFRQATFMLVNGVVDVLAVLDDGRQMYALLVEQSRLAVGQFVIANPSGRADRDDETLEALVLRELNEEGGEGIAWSAPRNLNQLVTGDPDPWWVSPGAVNEEVTFFVVEAKVTPDVIDRLYGREAGLHDEGEHTFVLPTPLHTVPQALGARGKKRDLKAMTAWLMYQQATS